MARRAGDGLAGLADGRAVMETALCVADSDENAMVCAAARRVLLIGRACQKKADASRCLQRHANRGERAANWKSLCVLSAACLTHAATGTSSLRCRMLFSCR